MIRKRRNQKEIQAQIADHDSLLVPNYLTVSE